MAAGLDSVAATEFANALSDRFSNHELSPTLFFDHPTIQAVARLIAGAAHIAEYRDGYC